MIQNIGRSGKLNERSNVFGAAVSRINTFFPRSENKIFHCVFPDRHVATNTIERIGANVIHPSGGLFLHEEMIVKSKREDKKMKFSIVSSRTDTCW